MAIAGDMGGRLEYVTSWVGEAALLLYVGSAAEHTNTVWIRQRDMLCQCLASSSLM